MKKAIVMTVLLAMMVSAQNGRGSGKNRYISSKGDRAGQKTCSALI